MRDEALDGRIVIQHVPLEDCISLHADVSWCRCGDGYCKAYCVLDIGQYASYCISSLSFCFLLVSSAWALSHHIWTGIQACAEVVNYKARMGTNLYLDVPVLWTKLVKLNDAMHANSNKDVAMALQFLRQIIMLEFVWKSTVVNQGIVLYTASHFIF